MFLFSPCFFVFASFFWEKEGGGICRYRWHLSEVTAIVEGKIIANILEPSDPSIVTLPALVLFISVFYFLHLAGIMIKVYHHTQGLQPFFCVCCFPQYAIARLSSPPSFRSHSVSGFLCFSVWRSALGGGHCCCELGKKGGSQCPGTVSVASDIHFPSRSCWWCQPEIVSSLLTNISQQCFISTQMPLSVSGVCVHAYFINHSLHDKS